MNLLHRINDVLFPHFCIICSSIGADVCRLCLEKIHPRLITKCVYCSDYVNSGITHKKCMRKNGIDGVWVLFPYSPILRKIIHAVKYKNIKSAVRELIINNGQKTLLLQAKNNILTTSVLVPVPLSERRQRYRGFNQAETIAKSLSGILELAIDSRLVKRVKDTPPQSQFVNRINRQKNIQGAFVVNNRFQHKSIVLVDDIWTTGSTILELCSNLKKSGVEKVYAIVLSGKIQSCA